MIGRLVTATLLLSAAPALAQQAPQQAKSAKNDPNRMICQKVEQIGSRIASKRICMTALQWEEKRRADQEELQSAQSKTMGRPGQ